MEILILLEEELGEEEEDEGEDEEGNKLYVYIFLFLINFVKWNVNLWCF